MCQSDPWFDPWLVQAACWTKGKILNPLTAPDSSIRLQTLYTRTIPFTITSTKKQANCFEMGKHQKTIRGKCGKTSRVSRRKTKPFLFKKYKKKNHQRGLCPLCETLLYTDVITHVCRGLQDLSQLFIKFKQETPPPSPLCVSSRPLLTVLSQSLLVVYRLLQAVQ